MILEKGESGWGAHVPDLPGRMAVAESRQEVVALIRDAIDFHLEGLREHGAPIPRPFPKARVLRQTRPERQRLREALRFSADSIV